MTVRLIDPFQQRPRQRAATGADLDQAVVALRVDGGDDAPDVVAIDQKILAEAFAGTVLDQAWHP